MLRNFLVLSYYNSQKNHIYPLYARRILFALFIALVAFLGAYSISNAQTTTPEKIGGRCVVFVNARPINSDKYFINWQSYFQGVTSTTTNYSWSGTPASSAADLPATNQHIQTEHTSDGSYSGTVTGRAGDQSLSLTCSARVNLDDSNRDFPGLSGSCNPKANGMTVFWDTEDVLSDPRQGTTTFSWTGQDGVATTAQRFYYTYQTEGVKRATLRIARDNEELNLSCETYVSSTTGSGCFIATAAFGTELEPEVVTLRKFRDEDLLTNKIGREFVSAYYKVSPPIADYIRERDNLRGAVRLGLRPLIYVAGKLTN